MERGHTFAMVLVYSVLGSSLSHVIFFMGYSSGFMQDGCIRVVG